MGYNTKPYDHVVERRSMSVSKLDKRIKEAEAFAEKYPEFKYSYHNEYIQELRAELASRIGKK